MGVAIIFGGISDSAVADLWTLGSIMIAAIERQGYFVVNNNLKSGVAPDGEKIPGVWE